MEKKEIYKIYTSQMMIHKAVFCLTLTSQYKSAILMCCLRDLVGLNFGFVNLIGWRIGGGGDDLPGLGEVGEVCDEDGGEESLGSGVVEAVVRPHVADGHAEQVADLLPVHWAQLIGLQYVHRHSWLDKNTEIRQNVYTRNRPFQQENPHRPHFCK